MASSKKTPRNLVNKEIPGGFQAAHLRLREALNGLPEHDSFLYIAGYKVYCQIKKIKKSKKSKISDRKLFEILSATIRVVSGKQSHPEAEEDYRQELKDYHELANEISHFPRAKFLIGAMVAVIGFAIVVASGIVAAVSFGLLSLIGLTLVASTLAGGIAVGTGAVGVGALIGSGLLLFDSIKSNPLRAAMQNCEIAAREHYKVRK